MFLKIENRFQESFDQISLHGWILSVSMFISRLFKCVLLVPQLTECAEQKITVKTGPFDYVKLFTPSLFSIIIGGLLFTSLILLGGIIFMNLRRKKIQRRLAVIENDLDTQLIEVARTEATGHLGASLAHELKQPIAAILLNAQGAIQVLKLVN